MSGRRFLSFCAVGAVGFAVDGGCMLAISSAAQLSPVHARPFSFLAAVTVTWLLNRYFTFTASSRRSGHEWARYAGVNSLGAGINLTVFYLLMLAVPQLRPHPLIVLAIASAVALLFNYAASARLVFATANRSQHGKRGGP